MLVSYFYFTHYFPCINFKNKIYSKFQQNEEPLECLINELKVIEDECKIGLPRQLIAEKFGAFNLVLHCLRKFYSQHALRDQCLLSLAALTDGYPDILTEDGTESLTKILDEVIVMLA